MKAAKKIGVLYYGIDTRSRWFDGRLIAVTAEKYGGRRWYGRKLKPGVPEADCEPTNSTHALDAKFATREAAEAALAQVQASWRIYREIADGAERERRKIDEAARAEHLARVALVPGVKPAS